MQRGFRERDRLLYVLSGRLAVAWTDFKCLYDQLTRTECYDHKFGRSNLLRVLQSLGHCEADFLDGKGTVYITEPILARLPWRGLPSAVLCGWRNPSTVEKLEETCDRLNLAIQKISVEEQVDCDSLTPSRITVTASTLDELEALARETDILFEPVPPSQRIMAVAASLADYRRTLLWQTKSELSWEQKIFDTKTFQFSSDAGPRPSRLVRYSNPQRRNSFLYLLWNQNQCAEVDLDFGRYIALENDCQQVVIFDPELHLFAHPSTVPLPALLARALVMCSGRAPGIRVAGEVKFSVYCMVPYSVARAVATKLGQELILGEFETLMHQVSVRNQVMTNEKRASTYRDSALVVQQTSDCMVSWLYEYNVGDDEYKCVSPFLGDEKHRPVKRPDWIIECINRAQFDKRIFGYLLGALERLSQDAKPDLLVVVPNVFNRGAKWVATELCRLTAGTKMIGADMLWRYQRKTVIDGTNFLFGRADWRTTPPFRVRNPEEFLGKHVLVLDVVFDSDSIPKSYANYLIHIGAARITYVSVLKTDSTATLFPCTVDRER